MIVYCFKLKIRNTNLKLIKWKKVYHIGYKINKQN